MYLDDTSRKNVLIFCSERHFTSDSIFFNFYGVVEIVRFLDFQILGLTIFSTRYCILV